MYIDIGLLTTAGYVDTVIHLTSNIFPGGVIHRTYACLLYFHCLCSFSHQGWHAIVGTLLKASRGICPHHNLYDTPSCCH